MSVSLCLMVRNEEEKLAACLRSAAGLVDETIVVDTGSIDGTRELSANRLTSETDNFSSYALGYDNANRLTSVDNNGTPNMPRVILTYGYDNFSNRTSIADNSGATENLTYDSDNNLTNVNISKLGFSNSN